MPGRGRGTKRKTAREEEPERLSLLEDSNPASNNIWVVGDSLVRWAGARYSVRSRNALGDDIVDWDGHSGLKVEDLHSKMQLGVLKGKSPKMIFLHIGGNNIVNTNVCKIIRQLKCEIRCIFENFQSAIIVWVFILPRLSWLWQGKGSDLACMNRKRQRVNRSISQFMLTQPNGRSLHIKSIDKGTPGFFRADN
ncbi:uncharacterized protein LOC132741151 [Ruditapes philippinarum]|uniref:uncharacterized protein LOC132741151 n=1 Tax=Ruditapes philippinarum TaxID=129788 RepID=UPI00295AB104|nr:uncharacterized protein LOC132741151 [Ruditapes philippinarum]